MYFLTTKTVHLLWPGNLTVKAVTELLLQSYWCGQWQCDSVSVQFEDSLLHWEMDEMEQGEKKQIIIFHK